MKPRARLAVVLAATLLTAGAARADSLLPIIGGDGGREFTDRCPERQVLIGLKLRAGDDIDQARPVCGMARDPVHILYTVEGGAHGGEGGSPVDVMCPAETPAVVRMDVVAQGIDGLTVNEVTLFCDRVSPDRVVPSYPSAHFAGPEQGPTMGPFGVGGSDPRNADGKDECPAGQVAVGIRGRSGDLLDAVGLICGPAELQVRIGRAHAPPPPPPPKPLTPVDKARIYH